MCFTSSSYTTLSSVTQAGLTIPAGLDTKINKHIGFWGQISRLILEIWYERLTEKHTVESQSTGCHHFRWSGVKKAAHSPFTAWNNVSFTPLSQQDWSHSKAAIGAAYQHLAFVPCSWATWYRRFYSLRWNLYVTGCWLFSFWLCWILVLQSGTNAHHHCFLNLMFKINK